ncbi:unnamed protein product, partial [marine sediment metagenome]
LVFSVVLAYFTLLGSIKAPKNGILVLIFTFWVMGG